MTQRTVMIVQARMGSQRLPGKSMMLLAGEPLVGRILERIKRCKKIDEIVLAIPKTKDNHPLYELGLKYNVTIFSGSEDNLIDRYYQAAIHTQADIVGRLPADNPVPEPEEIDRIIEYHHSLPISSRGFTSNLAQINNSNYPDGIGAEIFDFSFLETIKKRVTDKRLKEHIHLNFFDYAIQRAVDETWCPINTLECPRNFARPDLILDVNTEQQYRYMSALYEDLYLKNPHFHITDIIDWHDSRIRNLY